MSLSKNVALLHKRKKKKAVKKKNCITKWSICRKRLIAQHCGRVGVVNWELPAQFGSGLVQRQGCTWQRWSLVIWTGRIKLQNRKPSEDDDVSLVTFHLNVTSHGNISLQKNSFHKNSHINHLSYPAIVNLPLYCSCKLSQHTCVQGKHASAHRITRQFHKQGMRAWESI